MSIDVCFSDFSTHPREKEVAAILGRLEELEIVDLVLEHLGVIAVEPNRYLSPFSDFVGSVDLPRSGVNLTSKMLQQSGAEETVEISVKDESLIQVTGGWDWSDGRYEVVEGDTLLVYGTGFVSFFEWFRQERFSNTELDFLKRMLIPKEAEQELNPLYG